LTIGVSAVTPESLEAEWQQSVHIALLQSTSWQRSVLTGLLISP